MASIDRTASPRFGEYVLDRLGDPPEDYDPHLDLPAGDGAGKAA